MKNQRIGIVCILLALYSIFILIGPVFDELLFWEWVKPWNIIGFSKLTFYEITQLGGVSFLVLGLTAMGYLVNAKTDIRMRELLLIFFALFALYQPGLADRTINLIKGFPERFTLQLSFGWFKAVVYQPFIPLYDVMRVFTGTASILMIALNRIKLFTTFYIIGILMYISLIRIITTSSETLHVILAYTLVYGYFTLVLILPLLIMMRNR